MHNKNLEFVLGVFKIKNFYKLIYLSSIYISSVIIFVSYDITLSPDFENISTTLSFILENSIKQGWNKVTFISFLPI